MSQPEACPRSKLQKRLEEWDVDRIDEALRRVDLENPEDSMVPRFRLVVLLLLVLAALVSATGASATEGAAGVQVGYGQGPGLMVNTTMTDFARNFPLDVRFGLGYTSQDPGDPSAARRIFINDGTNGTPQESGRTWDFRVDLMFDVDFFGKADSYVIVGPRYSRFTGSFRYVGGNEAFDVTSSQWGLGVGFENCYPLLKRKRTDLVVAALLDYYLEDSLNGHDTTYNPSGSDVNARRNYGYGDADAAIEQPKLVPRLMVGVNYSLGK